MPVDLYLVPDGVKGESADQRRRAPLQHASLGLLVAHERRRGAAGMLSAFAHGSQHERQQLVLAELRRLGVFEWPAPPGSELDRTGLSLVGLQSGPGKQPHAKLPALLIITGAPPGVTSLPAVQKVHEAAARMKLPAGLGIFVASAPSAAGPSGHAKWTELTSFSNG